MTVTKWLRVIAVPNHIYLILIPLQFCFFFLHQDRRTSSLPLLALPGVTPSSEDHPGKLLAPCMQLLPLWQTIISFKLARKGVLFVFLLLLFLRIAIKLYEFFQIK